MARRPRPIRGLERVLDRIREEVEADIETGLSESGMLLSGVEVDVLDRGDEIVVLANVPGYGKDDVAVTAEDGRLVIVASRGDGGGDGEDGEDGDGEVEVLRRERPDRELRRIVRLPVPVDAGGAEASCDRGVLEVVLPKADGTDGTEIAIE